ncbi:hypothetical protein [Dactylosporangium sp. NPDC005555]|uniref:hypothetical protein n=1 Tax=Dactylosporangium sp. NPDC005555 TaxID=3154889 RepID=UPI0033BAC045
MTETYHRWRLPQLWEMLAADDAANAHLHLATLRRQQTALETHRDRLRTLRDHLTEAWPPQKSEAATAFVDKLNDMIDAMTGAARGAGEVRTGLAHIVDVIQESRSKMAALVADYEKASEVADPRISRHAKNVLDQRARDVLIAADATVVKALGPLNVALPVYTRFSVQGVIPVATPGEARPGSTVPRSASNGGAALTDLRTPRFEPPVATVPDDLALAGGQTADIVPASGPPVSGRSIGSEALTYPVIGTRGVTAESGSAGRTATTRPFGAPVIGGAAPAGSSRGGGGTAAAMHRPSTVTPPMGRASGAGGYRDRSFDEYAARRRAPRGDGDGTWSVPEGVRPVLEAVEPTAHDPGPGVLGLDR